MPAYIRSFGLALDREDRAYLRRKLGLKPGKLARAIECVRGRIEDVNGPPGGTDTVSRVKVALSDMESVIVESRGSAIQVAMGAALGQVETIVSGRLSADAPRIGAQRPPLDALR